MSWFKKIFGSQSSSQGSSQSSSQEARVYYTCNISTKEKNETDNNEKESENVTVSELEECDDGTQSTQVVVVIAGVVLVKDLTLEERKGN